MKQSNSEENMPDISEKSQNELAFFVLQQYFHDVLCEMAARGSVEGFEETQRIGNEYLRARKIELGIGDDAL